MNTEERETQDDYKVVVNDEDQHSIWPLHRTTPTGWREAGFSGAKDDCLTHIDEVWTDITPLSVRKALRATETV